MPVAEAAATRKRKHHSQQLSPDFRQGLMDLARNHSDEFSGRPAMKNIATRYFRALLQPHKPSGRPRKESIRAASRLLGIYRRRYPSESPSDHWCRIYAKIPNLETARDRRNLRLAVRSRSYRRKRSKAK